MFYQLGAGLTPYDFARILLSSTSLALLTVTQALTFLLFFVRLVSGLVKQRNIEDRAATEREGVLFRGLGWLAVGIKLSAIESILGWITPSFGLVFTRRGLRMIGRACIIIGVVKGFVRAVRHFVCLSDIMDFRPELREEFIILDNENGRDFPSGTRKLRVSGPRLHISSPTLMETSMSQRLSRMTFLRPFAQSGSDPEQIPSNSRRTSVVPLSPSTPTPTTGAKARPPPLILKRSSSRVTVIHSHGRAPTLVLNLSSTGLPSSGAIAAMSEKLQSDPVMVMVPPPLSGAAPLTAPLPRTHLHLRPPENHASTSGSDRGRQSSDGSALHRRPDTSPVDFGAMQSRRPSRSMPSSPRAPFTFLPAPAAIPPSAPQRARASEDRAQAPRSSMPDRHTRDNSTASGMSTGWITSEDESRDSYIKTVGTVQPRMTPNPTRDLAVRTSIVLERLGDIVEPPAPPPSPEQGLLVRKDSGVLGKDDLVRVRRVKSVY